MSIYLWIVGTLCFLMLWFWSSKIKKRKIDQAFSGRQPLTSALFYDNFFRQKGVSKDIVYGVREILEEQLSADLSCLHAEDDFSKNLKFFFEGDSMVDVSIVVALEERFEIKITDLEAEQAHTVEDIINLVSKKIRN